MSKDHLGTYLNDHLAGANVALDILDALRTDSPQWEATLAALKVDIEDDSLGLTNLMDRLGVGQSKLRKAGSWIAQRMVDLKLDVIDQAEESLRRFERLEALAIGIHGKLALWKALETAASANPELRGMDYQRLMRRAQEQREQVEDLRLQAAQAALA